MFTIPHSGERVPEKASWLKVLPKRVLLCDVDRFVDLLYEPSLLRHEIPFVKAQWHRYAVDLNRIPEDVDQSSVQGSALPAGTHPKGFHWVETTLGDRILPSPMTKKEHEQLVALAYTPFHDAVKKLSLQLSQSTPVYHIDAHSMPSRGTKAHRDPGEERSDVVISDCGGKSCRPDFRDLVIAAYVVAGFRVGYNWPYLGGRVTEVYGRPEQNHHTLQVELNRRLYMDEETKERRESFDLVKTKLDKAVEAIKEGLRSERFQKRQ